MKYDHVKNTVVDVEVSTIFGNQTYTGMFVYTFFGNNPGYKFLDQTTGNTIRLTDEDIISVSTN